MKRFIAILCVLVILMLGALCALCFGKPQWIDKAVLKVGDYIAEKTENNFAYQQSDAELTRIVSAQFPLQETYAPDDLVNLYEHKERSFQLARADIELRQPAFDAAQEMFLAAKADGVEGFILTSGYRTREYQQQLYEESDGSGYVNAPGESEHEYGLTFDVTAYSDSGAFADTEQFKWLSEHCWDYGFILRYPADKERITGVPYEAWHYRYVGAEAAREMKENNWCLEEYAVYRAK